jgi:hypothetical protein
MSVHLQGYVMLKNPDQAQLDRNMSYQVGKVPLHVSLSCNVQQWVQAQHPAST